MVDLKKYQKLKEDGKTPVEACTAAHTEGLNDLDCFKIMCNVYHLSLEEAKEALIIYHHNCNSLCEYQEKHILPMLKELFGENKMS